MVDGKKIDIMVSVIMVTYGHEKYICEAIEGVLIQFCNFDVELIIANDCSPDRTDAVVKEYLSKVKIPSNLKINYIQHEVNKGANENFIWAKEQSSGKYIAICEGDDYWTDPLKLQKQVDFLETNVEYVIHSGMVEVLEHNHISKIIGNCKLKSTYDLTDFLTKNNLNTCSVVFKNLPISTKYLQGLAFGDWMLYVLLLYQRKGNLAFVDTNIYAVYRVHTGGIMHSISNNYKSSLTHIDQIIAIKNYVNCKYVDADLSRINDYCLNIFSDRLYVKDYKNSLAIIIKNISLSKNNFPLRNYLGIVKNQIYRLNYE